MERYLTELEYQMYIAKQDLLEHLDQNSYEYHNLAINEQQLEFLNELAIRNIGTYVKKVVTSVQKAVNDFRTGYNASMWKSFKTNNEDALKSGFKMKTPENGITAPRIAKIENEVLGATIPDYDEKQTYKDRDAFYAAYSNLSVFYAKDKKPREVTDESCFEEIKNSVLYTNNEIQPYIRFMDNYSTNSDKISADIKKFNDASKEVMNTAKNLQDEAKKKEEEKKKAAEKAEEEKKKAEEKAKQDAENAKKQEAQAKAEADKPADNSGPAPQVNTASFSFTDVCLADIFMEAFFQEADDEAKAEDKPAENKEEDKGPLGDEEYKAKLDYITLYFNCATEIMSAKMKTLNKARALSTKLLNNYCKLYRKDVKEKKKEDKEAGGTGKLKSTRFARNKSTNTTEEVPQVK